MSSPPDIALITLVCGQIIRNHFRDVAKQLEEKSNVRMEDDNVDLFKQKILEGDYFPQQI